MLEYKYKNIYVKGITIGGIKTCYILPYFNIAFDFGRAPESLISIPTVFLTHSHLDHSSGMFYYISQRSLKGLGAPTIYTHPKNIKNLKKISKLWNKLENFEAKANILPIKEFKDQITIQKNIYVQAISGYHRVPMLGYVVMEKTKKLKVEYLKCSSEEIINLKKTENIFEEKESAIFSFSGDTTIEFVLNNPCVQNSKVLFMECTYLDDSRPVQRARDWGHTHLDEIIQHEDKFKNERLVLVHISKRYKKKEIIKILEKKLPSSLKQKVDVFQTLSWNS